MPVPVSYPGVYVQEIASGSRTITGVATSICAFVGRALRGPVDKPVRIDSYGDFERTFGGVWGQSGLGYAVRDYYLNGGQTAVVVRLVAKDAAVAELPAGWLPIAALGPGEWGNKLKAVVTHPADEDAKEIAAAQGVAKEALFHLKVVDETSDMEEQFLNVTVVDGPRRVDRVLESSTLVRVSGTLPGTPPMADEKEATGGKDGGVLAEKDYVDTNFETGKKGLYALEKVDLFTLLCLPPPDPAGDLPDNIWASALSYCAQRKAFLLVDPPSTSTLTDIKAWPAQRGLIGSAARNGALYFPRIRRPDPVRDGSVGEFVPCGAVAGTVARTDTERGVWKAPAGTDAGLLGVNGLTVTMTDAENGTLNPVGINCLRTFRDIGSVVWGARTLRGADVLADEYKYIPVRRLALYIEESLYRGTQWVVFEPNDEPLWAQIRMNVGAFMQDLFRQGAFQGKTPREAYFVRCDHETTTQFDIDRGIVNIVVGFAPLKPAEFVVISIQQKTADTTA